MGGRGREILSHTLQVVWHCGDTNRRQGLDVRSDTEQASHFTAGRLAGDVIGPVKPSLGFQPRASEYDTLLAFSPRGHLHCCFGMVVRSHAQRQKYVSLSTGGLGISIDERTLLPNQVREGAEFDPDLNSNELVYAFFCGEDLWLCVCVCVCVCTKFQPPSSSSSSPWYSCSYPLPLSPDVCVALERLLDFEPFHPNRASCVV